MDCCVMDALTGARLQELVAELVDEKRVGEAAKQGAALVKEMGTGREGAHARLCAAMVAGACSGGNGEKELLHVLGPAAVLSVAYTCLSPAT